MELLRSLGATLTMRAPIFLLLIVSTEAMAGQVMPPSVLACLVVKEDSQRLACFDQEVGRYRLLPVQTFGLSSEQIRRSVPTGHDSPAEVNVVSSKVISISVHVNGTMVIGLENQQVWAQVAAENFGRVVVGDEVTVRPGMMGTYFLYTARKQATKVVRVK